ncbi:MAG TPA: nucleoside-diphosphate kinase, partial [Elusimicrobiales bacterium]|nr:nucleoside-diphosphate kinase [Elusimicrobiales bacterium]
MAIERTLILIKPNGIKRRLAGLCLSKLESLGMELVGAKVLKVSKELVAKHYQHLKKRPFFNELIEEISGKKVLAFIYEGNDAVSKMREIVGATNPEKSKPGTIRNSFGRIRNGKIENIIHASSSVKDSKREIDLWFSKG